MNKYILYSILLIFIFIAPSNAEDNYIIDGNIVYIDDENVYLSAYPHTIYESGYVYFNFTSKNYNGNIDTAFGFNTSSVKPKKVELYNSNTNTWKTLPLSFTLLSKTYQNCDKWYYVKDISIISNKNYMIRIWIETPISTNINKGKYLFAVKPSFETIQQSINNNRLYVLDPWFNTSFTDRQRIIITTNGTIIPQNYQILLNVTYNLSMQNDFDDLRFTNSSNGSLPYWIEFKNNSNYANVWVNLSDEIIHPNTDVIYMYFGNNQVSSKSNITKTMVFGDDYTGILINILKWDEIDTLDDYITQNNKLFFSGGNLVHGDVGISSNKTYLRPFIYETYIRTDELNSRYIGIKDNSNNVVYLDFVYMISLHTDNNLYVWEDGNNRGIKGTYNINTDYWLKIEVLSTGAKWYWSIDNKENWNLLYTSVYSLESPLKIGVSIYNGQVEIDNTFIRKYIVNKPIISYNVTEYYTTTLYYNSTSNYNHTIELDGTIIVNRSLNLIDNTHWSAKSTNITYWVFTKQINKSGYTNFTIENNNLNNFTVKLKQYSYYNLSNSSLVNTFSTNQYGTANIDINLIPDDYYINFINQSLIPPPIYPLYPIQGILMFKDNICLNNINKIIVYKNNSYIGIYNYSDEISYSNNTNYTFFINYDNIDIINSEKFLISFFKNYGYILISIISLIILFSLFIYFLNKVRR